MLELGTRLAHIDARISEAARAVNRDVDTLTRIVVTKFHPASLVEELYRLGVRDAGENRQQELSSKRAEVTGAPDLTWHFIGQAQTNKARAIRAAASVVHSVDRSRLALALDAAATEDTPLLDVLVQVNLTDDPGRGGVAPSGIEQLAESILECRTLRLRGVMGVAPLDEPPAPAFERLAEYSTRMRAVASDADWISAGMTADFVEAIAAGATHLRIGSAITGPRPVAG